MRNNTNHYAIQAFEPFYRLRKNSTTFNDYQFGIEIHFGRNSEGIHGILMNYHLMCATLVIVTSINFLIDPKVVPGRAGLLVTIFLVLTNFFTSAQVSTYLIWNWCTYHIYFQESESILDIKFKTEFPTITILWQKCFSDF